MYIRGTGTVLTQKVIQEKSTILTKILNYTKSSCVIFCAKMFRYYYYTYLPIRRINTFWSKGDVKFWSGIISTVQVKKIK